METENREEEIEKRWKIRWRRWRHLCLSSSAWRCTSCLRCSCSTATSSTLGRLGRPTWVQQVKGLKTTN